MNDPIEELVRKIQSRPDILESQFTPSSLDSVAEIFEREGPEATRLYLLGKQYRSNPTRPNEQQRRDYQQFTALLAVLDLMRYCNPIQQRRAIGRTLLKALPALRRTHYPIASRGDSANTPGMQSPYPTTPRGQSRHQNSSRGPRR